MMKKTIPIIALLLTLAASALARDYSAVVLSAYDGDTATISIQVVHDPVFNLRIYITEKVRLVGIDAPEVRGPERPEGLKSRDYLRQRVVGRTIVLKVNKLKPRGKYGRILGILVLEGVDINSEMIDKGFAEKYDP